MSRADYKPRCARHTAGEGLLEGGVGEDVAKERDVAAGARKEGWRQRSERLQRRTRRTKRKGSDARRSDGGRNGPCSGTSKEPDKRSGFIAPAAAQLKSKDDELAPGRVAELLSLASVYQGCTTGRVAASSNCARVAGLVRLADTNLDTPTSGASRSSPTGFRCGMAAVSRLMPVPSRPSPPTPASVFCLLVQFLLRPRCVGPSLKFRLLTSLKKRTAPACTLASGQLAVASCKAHRRGFAGFRLQARCPH